MEQLALGSSANFRALEPVRLLGLPSPAKAGSQVQAGQRSLAVISSREGRAGSVGVCV